MSDSILDQVIQHPEVIYTLAQELVAEREQLEGIRKQLDAAQPKADYFDTFVKRLHDVRTSRGITQEELAVRLGLASKQHVSRMENGERSCSIDLLIELSCILHVSTDYLLMGSEPSKEEVKNDLLSIISELSTIAKKI